jgi:hypothetical protein
LLIFFAACRQEDIEQASQGLYSANSHALGYQNVDVIITELERGTDTSLVEIKFNSGSSVASSVFIACSFAELAKLRGYRYSIDIKNFGGSGRYLVGFLSSPTSTAINSLGIEFANSKVSEITDNEIFSPICQRGN